MIVYIYACIYLHGCAYMYGDSVPKFIESGDLGYHVLDRLKELYEVYICIFICMFVFMFICIYIYIYIHMYIYINMYVQEWAGGIELKGTSAYGVRLYQNGSSLVMHHDKVGRFKTILFINMYTYIYIFIYIYICIYICIYIYIYIYIYICICMYT
jgi:hypothetical protein